MNKLSMNTGLNTKERFESNLEYEADNDSFEIENHLLLTPVKKGCRLIDHNNDYYNIEVQEFWATSGQRSINSPISRENEVNLSPNKRKSNLSPFSKYWANLSPLYKRDQGSYKHQRITSISKFSVEHMKSPSAIRIDDGRSDSWLREQTPEKIDFNLEEDDEENNTPTFNLHNTEELNVEFDLIDRRPNLSDNKNHPDEKAWSNAIEVSKISTIVGTKKVKHRVDKNERIRHHQEVKSKGSTSPESYCFNKNSHDEKKLLSDNKNQHTCLKFSVSKTRDDEKENSNNLANNWENLDKKDKKREGKVIRKKSEPLQNRKTSISDKPKGCTCKKSQWKKMYCECFLNQKIWTSACACFSCWNTTEHQDMILEIRKAILKKNPNAFSDKLKVIDKDATGQGGPSAIHTNGCKCKRSKCLTGYWECHQLGAKCSDLCKCESCENQVESKILETPPKIKLADECLQFS